jgi:hypothetical protein
MTAEQELERFIGKYTPEIAAQIRAVRSKLRRLIPGATELVWDNYNALAIGFAATERTGDVVVSIAAYPRWVSLFLFDAADLPDPDGLLRGKGKQARHIVLDAPDRLDDPGVRALIAAALRRAKVPIDPSQRRRVVIRSVSAKQRPRRPAGKR